MIEAVAAAAATATSSDWFSMLYLVIHVHVWCGVRRVELTRVIVYGLCDPREQFMCFAGPRTGIISALQLSSATFATQKVCKLLLQIARLLSKVKVSKLFAQLFAPIKSVHEETWRNKFANFHFFRNFLLP